MKHYYFNDHVDDKGNHEVHTEDCSFLPAAKNRTYIGYFADCSSAIAAAKASHPFDECVKLFL